MVRDQQVCPACGRHVGTLVRRHKTLGAYVPQFRPAPCRRPDCPSNQGGSTRCGSTRSDRQVDGPRGGAPQDQGLASRHIGHMVGPSSGNRSAGPAATKPRRS
jgi:hypothetical protein